MRTLEKNILPALLALVAFYTLYTQPVKVTFFTFMLAFIAYGFTRGLEYAILVIVFSLSLNGFNAIFGEKGPVGVEAFQVKDPVSIQARLAQERVAAPLAPKVEGITGVLESPSILDNVPLNPAQELTNDAQPGKSIPASAKSRVLIYPVPEGFVPNQGTQDLQPKLNPYLQNGPDDEGVETALLSDGTDAPPMEKKADEEEGVETGVAPAF